MNKKNTAERLRAFTVHPGWAWALLAGVKKQELRRSSDPSRNCCATFLPQPRNRTVSAFTWLSVARADRAPLGLLRGGCGGPFARFVGR